MTSIVVRCPKCKSQYRIKNAEEMDGKKVLCKKCRTPIRIEAPAPAGEAESNEDEFGSGGDSFEDEFAGASTSARAPLPIKRLKKKKGTFQKSSNAAAKPGEGKPEKASATKTALIIVAALVGALALGGLGIGGIWLMKSGGIASAKYEAPDSKRYVDFRPKNSALSCRIPANWSQDWGGGMGGQPHWIRVGDDRLKIEVRESIAGGAIAATAIAEQQRLDPTGQDESLSPATKVHESQKHDISETYTDYQEEPAQKITTQFGVGRISDFTAKDGMLKYEVRGCRATMFNNLHQFTASFKCPPAMFKDAKPVFIKVTASIGGGTAP